MRQVLISFFVLICLYACKPGGADQKVDDTMTAKDMEASLMMLHDSAMVKLNEINRLSAELRNVRAEVNVSDQGSAAYPAGLDKVLEDLKLADQGMWDWMKTYSDNKAKQTEEQLKAFYQSEAEKMNAVSKAIDNSIANAKAWLAAHGTSNK